MIDLQLLRFLAASSASVTELQTGLEVLLADPSVTAPSHSETSTADRRREKTRHRVKRWRHKKKSELLSQALHSVTLPPPDSVTERYSVTVTLPTALQSVTEEICSSKTNTCKDKEFPDLNQRFKLPVTLSERYGNAVGNAHSMKSIPCQNTLFPLDDDQERKEETKEEKKESAILSVRKKESKNLYAGARAREATEGQGKASRSRARVPIPDNWFSAAAMGFALSNGLTAPMARFEAERFADHARANGRLCAGEVGWLAAWRNWIRSPYRRGSGAPPVEPFDVRRHIV